MISLQRRCKKHRQNQVFSIRGGLTFEKITPEILFYGTSGRDFMLFGVLPDSNNFIILTIMLILIPKGIRHRVAHRIDVNAILWIGCIIV